MSTETKSLMDVCAEKDAEIARLKAELRGKLYATGETDESKDRRIAELERECKEWARQHEVKDQRIAELEACIKKELDIAEEWQAMYALLEKVPHVPALHVGFFPNCPACAWAKLKEGK